MTAWPWKSLNQGDPEPQRNETTTVRIWYLRTQSHYIIYFSFEKLRNDGLL